MGLEGGAGRGAAACIERLQLYAAALETWLLQVPWVNANLKPTLCLHCKPNPVLDSLYPLSKDTEPVGGGNGTGTQVSQGDFSWLFTHQELQGELTHLNVKELSTKE